MSKAYPSNLTHAQYEFLSDMIRNKPNPVVAFLEVDMWEILNAIFYVLVEGVRWLLLPGDFPPWQTGGGAFLALQCTHNCNQQQDGTWLKIHDSLREWIRIEIQRHKSPTEAIIDRQSVKSAAMVHQSVGYDAGKKILMS